MLALVRLVVNTMERFVYPFLPAIARGLGIGLDQAGLLLAIRSGSAIAMPALVATAGRDGRRRRQMTVALACTAVGALVAVGPWGFAVVAGGWALIGVGKPTYDVGALAYLSDRTPYAIRARVLGITELSFALGLLVGAPVAGWLISRWDWRAPFVAVAVLAVASIPVLRRVVEPGHPSGGDPPVRLRLRRRDVLFLATVALFMFGTEATLVVMGAWLEDDFGLSLLGLGGVAALLGGAEVLGEGLVLGGADRLGKRRTVVAGLAVGALGYALVATVGTTAVAGLASLALALFGFEAAIVSAIPLGSELRPGARAPFLALLGTCILGGRAIGDLVGPALYLRHGIEATATLSAVSYVLSIGLLLRSVADDRPHAGDPRSGGGG